MIYIDKQWQRYRQMIVSPEAGAAQVRDTRDAFFGGAMTLFGLLISGVSEGSEDEITSSDMQMMTDIQVELDTWQAEVEARIQVKQ